MQLKWTNVGNVTKTCCGSSVKNVRFVFYRKVGAAWSKTFETPWVNNGNQPQSNLLRLPVALLCNADMNAEIKISAVTPDGEVNRVTLTLE